ncbi:MAG: YkvA family protein [Bacteroidia bacterium]|nr:YkvA family protein [Bacteroidia bacterium]
MSNPNIDASKLIAGYEKNYTDSDFWLKIKSSAIKAGAKVIYYALVLYYTATASTTSASDKIKIWSALGYFILPFDLIPDVLPGGYADDLAALIYCYNLVKANITPSIKAKAKQTIIEWLEIKEIELIEE